MRWAAVDRYFGWVGRPAGIADFYCYFYTLPNSIHNDWVRDLGAHSLDNPVVATGWVLQNRKTPSICGFRGSVDYNHLSTDNVTLLLLRK